jgi:hypothetical protein
LKDRQYKLKRKGKEEEDEDGDDEEENIWFVSVSVSNFIRKLCCYFHIVECYRLQYILPWIYF